MYGFQILAYCNISFIFFIDEEEKALQAMENTLQKGEDLSQTIIQCMFLGFPGGGKSSLMNKLIGRPHQQRFSTPVAEPAIQVCIPNIKDEGASESPEWHILTHGGEAQVLFYQKVERKEKISIPQQDVQQEQSVAEASKPMPEPPHSTKLPMAASDVASPDSIQDIKFSSKKEPSTESTIEEGIHVFRKRPVQVIFNEAIRNKDFSTIKDLLKKGSVDTLYLTDTGGQMEFQELLPALVAGHFIIFLVFTLPSLLKLDEKFDIVYRHPSKKDVTYESTYTVKETLLRSLDSIACMCRSETAEGANKAENYTCRYPQR